MSSDLLAFLESEIEIVERRLQRFAGQDIGTLIPLSDRCFQMGLAVAAGKVTGETKEQVVARIQKRVGPTKRKVVKRAAKKRVVVRRKK